MKKIRLLLISIWGELIKLYYRTGFYKLGYGLNRTENRSEKVIVSLTSYGRRVESVLPYTIISLLKQTYKPDKIVLWLDYEHWNDGNIPESINRLKQYGLTICYCRDIKSYKKLIPALEKFPDDIIITCDDDLYYRKDMIEKLISAYEKDPSRIYTHRAHQVRFDKEGNLLPYNEWDMEISSRSGSLVFPTGGGGCLYKRSLLFDDIGKESLFMNLSPKADDVWFYFMEKLAKTECCVLPYDGQVIIPLDAFFQYFHKGASLASLNCRESQNDVQIRNVMKHYNLTDSDLKL